MLAEMPAKKKCLGANKLASYFANASRAQAKEHFHAQNEDQEQRKEALSRSPILTKKTTKNKRHLRGITAVHETNMGSMAQMLPFAGL